nr:protein YjjY [uncultured Enterobacter sp.]
MTKVRNCVLDALSINVNNIISLVVVTFPLDPTVSKTAVILTILTAT